jgi:cell division septation protein DedD
LTTAGHVPTTTGAEILSLPLTALKASKLTKPGEVADALSDANKATQALESAQDATAAVRSDEAIAKTDEVANAANASDATKAPESKGPPEGGTRGKIRQAKKRLEPNTPEHKADRWNR